MISFESVNLRPKPVIPPSKHQAVWVTNENYLEVAEWMGYKEVLAAKNGDGWYLKSSNVTYHLQPNRWLIDKIQQLDEKQFKEQYEIVYEESA
jgi:hypothetical protein